MSKYLKKTKIDGSDCYIEVGEDEAYEAIQSGIDVMFVDDSGNISHLEINEEEEDKTDTKDGSKESLSNKIQDYVSQFANKITDSVKSGIAKAKIKIKSSSNPDSRTSKLLKLLPFMGEEEIDELVDELLTSPDSLKDVNIVVIAPFLSDESCDKIFLKALRDGNVNIDVKAMAPFVSEKTLSRVVDLYLDGDYQDLDINSLYPFLSSKDIKRILKKVMSEKDE